MPRRQRRAGRKQWQKDESDYDSDDPRSYRDMKTPDPSSNEYFYDEVDEFHQDKDKILLDEDGTNRQEEGSGQEEEVLGWEDEDSEEELNKKAGEFLKHHHFDDMASDLEDEGGDEDETTDDKAWGQKKPKFYGADFVGDNILDNLQEDEEEEQAAEEEEARMIQRRMAEALDEGDFDMDGLQTVKMEEDKTELKEEEDKVKKDLSKLPKQEKLQILKKESPEMFELVEDFKSKLQEVLEQLQPLINKLRDGQIPKNTLGATYLQTKYHLYLNYCLNINFYMAMKAKHISVKNHPVIGRILAYRKLINEMKPADEQMKEEISLLLENDSCGSDEELQEKVTQKERGREKKRKREKKKLSSLLDESEDEKKEMVQKKKKKPTEGGLTEKEQAALAYYEKMEAEQLEKKNQQRDHYPEEEDEGEDYDDDENLQEGEGEDGEIGEGKEDMAEEEDEKRAITYQISKNKGLTSKRKKELRNPRVKNRSKFRKAKIRRKGQVQDVRTEMQRYGGELSGIRASVVKSTKLK